MMIQNVKQEEVDELRRKGDEAFREGKYDKAYKAYQNALAIEPKNYDLMACLIGAALNLGYLEDVWHKSELLIQMDGKRAQVGSPHQ